MVSTTLAAVTCWRASTMKSASMLLDRSASRACIRLVQACMGLQLVVQVISMVMGSGTS